jgi:hypothetical protein
MIPDNVKEVASLIGEFYLRKNDGDYDETADEIDALRIKEIVLEGNVVHIHTLRPGLLIGRRGTNIDALVKFLERDVKVHEVQDDILNWLIPNPPEPLDGYDTQMDWFWESEGRESKSIDEIGDN